MFSIPIKLWEYRDLIWGLSRREFEARYRGSLLGFIWAIVVPLAMLGVYSLVFGSIFGSRWAPPEAATHQTEYAFPLIMFSGLIIFSLFAEPVNRAPGLVLETVSYVKKVVFPLEILPVVVLTGAAINTLVSFGVFLAVFVLLHGLPPATMLLLPLVLLPILLITLGLVYILASLGVFLRDLKHVTSPLTTIILFLSPVFYSVEILPENYRHLIFLNPLTTGILQAQDVIFWGRFPDAGGWLVYLMFSLMFALAGAYWFTRTQKGFADVL